MAARSSPEISFPPPLRRRKPSIHGSAAFSAASLGSGYLARPPLNRRIAAVTAVSVAVTSFLNPVMAFESLFVAPEQTTAEAEAAVAADAKRLLELRPLVESRSWRELQQALREGAPLLKQDLYTIIQFQPRGLRPDLRKLFSNLFNGVTRLDYAARSKDTAAADELYSGIVSNLEKILGRIRQEINSGEFSRISTATRNSMSIGE